MFYFKMIHNLLIAFAVVQELTLGLISFNIFTKDSLHINKNNNEFFYDLQITLLNTNDNGLYIKSKAEQFLDKLKNGKTKMDYF